MAALRKSAKTAGLLPPPPRPRDDGACAECLAPLDPVGVRGKRRTYCSKMCSRRSNARRDAAAVTAARRLARPEPLLCGQCGADLSGRQVTVRYCSALCSAIARGARLAAPLPARQCALPDCVVTFIPFRDQNRCCSEAHGKLLWRIEAIGRGYQQPRRPWGDKRRDEYHRRRALKKNASTGEPVRLADILERDRWKCGLCSKRIPKRAKHPDPLSPSLDHIVPLTKGGAHDPANVFAAHLRCNVAKNNRGGGEQLALIG